jgi:hypothetical protein
MDTARRTLATDLINLRDQLSGASTALRTALPMLGAARPQRYFIGFENEAEARGIGGLPGAFAILTVDDGKLTFTHFGSDSELRDIAVHVDLGADFQARYGPADPTGTFQNSDISPDFTDAARIWAATWTKKSGQPITAAIAIDPTALSELLKVTGPATLPDGSKVSSNNVVALTQQTQYETFGDRAARKDYLSTVAKAVSNRLTGGGNVLKLLRAATRVAGERRILIWSADPAVQANLITTGYGGALSGGSDPFTGFVVVNATGSKLDYYLDRTMTYQRAGCGADSTTVATFTMTNSAPASGLPRFVTLRADDHAKSARPGDNRLFVTYYGTAGARIESVAVDGKAVVLASGTEKGLTTVTADIELAAGSTHLMTVMLREPAAHAPVQILRQPLVRPMTVSVTGASCS